MADQDPTDYQTPPKAMDIAGQGNFGRMHANTKAVVEQPWFRHIFNELEKVDQDPSQHRLDHETIHAYRKQLRGYAELFGAYVASSTNLPSEPSASVQKAWDDLYQVMTQFYEVFPDRANGMPTHSEFHRALTPMLEFLTAAHMDHPVTTTFSQRVRGYKGSGKIGAPSLQGLERAADLSATDLLSVNSPERQQQLAEAVQVAITSLPDIGDMHHSWYDTLHQKVRAQQAAWKGPQHADAAAALTRTERAFEASLSHLAKTIVEHFKPYHALLDIPEINDALVVFSDNFQELERRCPAMAPSSGKTTAIGIELMLEPVATRALRQETKVMLHDTHVESLRHSSGQGELGR